MDTAAPVLPDVGELRRGQRRRRQAEVRARRRWMLRAACLGMGVDTFFPSKGRHGEEALEVCEGCPVAEQCLDFAQAEGISAGIWGGTTGPERRRAD